MVWKHFAGKYGIASADHIEQYGVGGIGTWLAVWQIAREILCAERPRIVIAGVAWVFCVNKKYVNSYVRPFHAELSGKLKEDSHAAATVVGSVDGATVVFGIRVLVGPRTCVPVSEQKHSCRIVDGISSHNIVNLTDFRQFGRLLYDRVCSETGQLVGEVSGALRMWFRSRYARSERYLPGYVCVCAVGIKRCADGSVAIVCLHGRSLGWTVGTSAHEHQHTTIYKTFYNVKIFHDPKVNIFQGHLQGNDREKVNADPDGRSEMSSGLTGMSAGVMRKVATVVLSTNRDKCIARWPMVMRRLTSTVGHIKVWDPLPYSIMSTPRGPS